MVYNHTSKHLRKLKASDFAEGDTIFVGNYTINIRYGEYRKPLKSYTEKNYKALNCTPGVQGGTPYFIYDFLGR